MAGDSRFDVAVVGMSGRFPGARNPDEFWSNLAQGVESITRFSDDELLSSGVRLSQLSAPRYVKAAPVLDEPGHFDAAFFGYSPMEARSMDPQHRVLLELAHEALEQAGCDAERYCGRIGVFCGAALNTYFTSVGLSGRLAEDYIPTLIGNDKDFLATRISYKLNLKGPSLTVQSACSTSIVAIHLACQSLLGQETDMALAGAISVRVPHRAGYFCDGGGIVSPDAHVRAFDAAANGTVFGSGGGVLALKRLADALADGDTIYALIKGSAVNNDGSRKAGYTAPSVEGQADAVAEALANAGVEADTIGYVEAHGSGTPVGDPIEVMALTRAFRASTRRCEYCALGSVKTNVGHLDAAAGIAGVIKTILALGHRQIPPSLHFREPNPEIDFASTPFYVNTRLQPWESKGPRRAGVMATGMGGTNAHLVLEEAPDAPAATDADAPQLLLLSARTESALETATRQLRAFLDRERSVNLQDVAYTLQVGRKAFAHRRTVVCHGREDALTALSEGSKRVFASRLDETRRPVVLLCPGVGDQYAGMGGGLYETWPAFRKEIDRCSEILLPHLGVDLRSLLYPPDMNAPRVSAGKGIDLKKMLAREEDVPQDPHSARLNQTRFAQPALFATEYAMARLWQSLGVVPDAILGHSLGEYVAACIAGVFSLEDALRLVAVRANLVNELPLGGMLAVGLPEQELQPLLCGQLSISLLNGPRLCVVAGPLEEVAQFEKRLVQSKIVCRRVRNGHAFHSRMLEPIAGRFEAELRKLKLGEPRIPFLSNARGTWITAREASSPAYWATQTVRTARLSDALHNLWQLDNPVLLEAGPGRTLSVLALQHPDRRDGAAAIASIRHDYENEPDLEVLLRGIGKLWLSGASIAWEQIPCREPRRKVSLPTYPFERRLHWLEPLREAGLPERGVIQKKPDPAEWLYVPSWKCTLPRSLGIDKRALAIRPCRWLVYADRCGLASVLVERLSAAGHDVATVHAGSAFQQADKRTFTIEASNPQHYASLIRVLQEDRWLPDRILHAWNVGDTPAQTEEERFNEAQASGFYSLVYLAKALAARNLRHDIELMVLSDGIHAIHGGETLIPEKSTLLGPCMVIRQEYPNLRVKSIDVDALATGAARKSAAEAVLREAADPDLNLFVAHRAGHRWIWSHEPLAKADVARLGSVLRRGGVYLITGGLGKVGVAISEYLAKNYRARLVLVGRSVLPARDSWSASIDSGSAGDPTRNRIEAIRRIERLGAEVLYVDADVSDSAAMSRAVECAYERFGDLHGVIHGAGIVGDGVYLEIKDTDRTGCEGHFRAKAAGVRALARALDGKSIDFCLLLSSLTSILGGIGQAAYAASNLYMDAFARQRSRTSSTPWLSVNWDVWRTDAQEAVPPALGATLRELGMSPAEAAATLERVLAARGAAQLIVSTGELGARIDQWVKLESLDVANEPKNPPPAMRSARPQRDAAEDPTEQAVARIWEAALGIDAVGANDNFAELGGHSLQAIKIVSELRRTFEVDLAVRALFEAPTVAQLSRRIREQIVAELESLSDEEAQSLASSG